jgi:hypothetical protein
MASQPQDIDPTIPGYGDSRPRFPPSVVAYIKRENARRTEYKSRLEQTPEYTGYDDFTRRLNLEQRLTLQSAIDRLTADIVAICKKHFPDIEVDSNPEVTISNVLASLPMPEELRRIRVISSRLGAP